MKATTQSVCSFVSQITVGVLCLCSLGAANAWEEPYDIGVSFSPDRSDAMVLEGAMVHGDIYAFVRNEPGIEQVSFWWDDPQRTGPADQVESYAPFDAAGTGDGSLAYPFDTTQLGGGSHSLTAMVVSSDGARAVITRSFGVLVVEAYAMMPAPTRLSFDPSGVLYVGSGLSEGKIYRVGVGGSPVEEFGDTPLLDPDAVAFDASGSVSGVAGAVLVGGSTAAGNPPGYIAAILPDEKTVMVFSPGSVAHLGNPNAMKFDESGRLLVADYYFGDLLVSIGSTPTTLFETRTETLATDQANRIFAQRDLDELFAIAPDGSTSAVVADFPEVISGLAFSGYDSTWGGALLALGTPSGNLYRVDSTGKLKKLLGGFTGGYLDDVAFGADGALYISNTSDDVIYRVVH